jgi:DNA-binding MarR family transcriptional regulator
MCSTSSTFETPGHIAADGAENEQRGPVRSQPPSGGSANGVASATTESASDPSTALGQRLSLVVHRVNARFTQIANKLLSTQGISMYDSRILLFLLEQEEMRVGELVQAMALPQSTISHQLKQLQTRKLIRRRRSRKDNRTVVVTLTPAGLEIARDCEQYSIYVQRCLIDSLSKKEMAQLTALLDNAFDVLEVSRFSPEQAPAATSNSKRPGNRRARRSAPNNSLPEGKAAAT